MAEFRNKAGNRALVTLDGEGRKKPGLYVCRGNQISKVATFGSKEDKEVFEMYADFLVNGKAEPLKESE